MSTNCCLSLWQSSRQPYFVFIFSQSFICFVFWFAMFSKCLITLFAIYIWGQTSINASHGNFNLNINKNLSKNFFLFHLVPKLGPLSSRKLEESSYLHIICTVEKGTPPLFFDWAKNGKTIKSGPNVSYKIENSDLFSTFIIKSLHRNDSGNYTCSVKNSIGFDSQSFVLSIKGNLMAFYYILDIFQFISWIEFLFISKIWHSLP